MNYLLIFTGFSFGFSLAVILIARVSIRPNAKKVLKEVGLIKDHKARSPRKSPEPVDLGEREI
jgi:hypothetical protein